MCKPPPTCPRIQGLGIRQVLVEEPIIRELCDQAGDQPPPAPQLGEEADYFRPSSTQVRIIIKTDEDCKFNIKCIYIFPELQC